MELHDYLATLRKRWLSILLVTVVALGGAATATFLATRTYTASSQVFVSVTTGGSTSDLLQGSSFTQKQVKSYVDLVTSPLVLGPVIEELKLEMTPEELAGGVSAQSPLDTVLINVTASSVDPATASNIANAVAESLGKQVTELERPADDQPSPVQISTVRTATVPTSPASPNTRLNLILGLLVGMSLGFAFAVVREMLDTKVRTEADIQKFSKASVVASIGYDHEAPGHPLIVQSSPQSHRSEAFRRLRTNLQFLDIADRPKTIVVTSSLPGEGKSTTTINLAISLADAGSRVVLIDADLRRPSIAEYMSLEGEVGLTTVLIGKASVEDVVQPWGNGYLHVLPSGQIPPNPSELLGSRSMANLLEHLTQLYDIVLIDTPPLLPVTDGAILAKLAGGALVVVGANKVHRQQVAEAMGSLETVGARVLGVVLNGLVRKQGESYMYYDYSSTEQIDSKSKRTRQRGAVSRASKRSAVRTGTRRTPSSSERIEAADTVDEIFGAPAPTRGDRWPGAPLSVSNEASTRRS